MIDPSIELQRALADTSNEAASSFSKPMRSGLMLNIEDGDVLEMPASLADLAGKIVRHTGLNDAESIFVSAKDAHGIEKVVEFFPGSLTRVGIEYKKASVPGVKPTRTGNTFPNSGDVVDAVRVCPTVDDAMKLLYGKKIKFTLAAKYTALRWGTDDVREAKSWVVTFA